MKDLERKANNEYYPLQFKILCPKIQEGRCDYEVHIRAKVLAKEVDRDWAPLTIKTCVKFSFRPSWFTIKAIAKDTLININSVFNEMSITRQVLKSSKRGLKLAKTVTQLKYEDWRFETCGDI